MSCEEGDRGPGTADGYDGKKITERVVGPERSWSEVCEGLGSLDADSCPHLILQGEGGGLGGAGGGAR